MYYHQLHQKSPYNRWDIAIGFLSFRQSAFRLMIASLGPEGLNEGELAWARDQRLTQVRV